MSAQGATTKDNAATGNASTGRPAGLPGCEGDDAMKLDDETTAATLPRLKRAQGQLAAVIRMLDEGQDCADVVTQLAAVSRALDRAGYKMLAGGLRQCVAAEAAGEASPMTPEQMERLFLSLA